MTCGGGRGGTLQCEDQVEERTAGRGGRGVVAVPDGAFGTSLCCALVGEGFRTEALAPSRLKPIPPNGARVAPPHLEGLVSELCIPSKA